MGDARARQQACRRLVSFNQSIQFVEGGTPSWYSLCHNYFPDIIKYHPSARLCSDISELAMQDCYLDK